MYGRIIIQETLGQTMVTAELNERSGVPGQGPVTSWRRSFYVGKWSDPGDWPDELEWFRNIITDVLDGTAGVR